VRVQMPVECSCSYVCSALPLLIESALLLCRSGSRLECLLERSQPSQFPPAAATMAGIDRLKELRGDTREVRHIARAGRRIRGPLGLFCATCGALHVGCFEQAESASDSSGSQSVVLSTDLCVVCLSVCTAARSRSSVTPLSLSFPVQEEEDEDDTQPGGGAEIAAHMQRYDPIKRALTTIEENVGEVNALKAKNKTTATEKQRKGQTNSWHTKVCRGRMRSCQVCRQSRIGCTGGSIHRCSFPVYLSYCLVALSLCRGDGSAREDHGFHQSQRHSDQEDP